MAGERQIPYAACRSPKAEPPNFTDSWQAAAHASTHQPIFRSYKDMREDAGIVDSGLISLRQNRSRRWVTVSSGAHNRSSADWSRSLEASWSPLRAYRGRRGGRRTHRRSDGDRQRLSLRQEESRVHLQRIGTSVVALVCPLSTGRLHECLACHRSANLAVR